MRNPLARVARQGQHRRTLWGAVLAVCIAGLILAACKSATPQLDLAPTSWTNLPDWQTDLLSEVYPALAETCRVYGLKDPQTPLYTPPGDNGDRPDKRFGTTGDWQPFCAELDHIRPNDSEALRRLMMKDLRPYTINGSNPQGLFTGYYEPELDARLVADPDHQIPLYRAPANMVEVPLRDFLPEYPELADRTLRGLVVHGKLVPMPTRKQIALQGFGPDSVLAWAADPVAVFMLQIQGSGRLRLADGHTINIGYAGQNGYNYVSLGRLMRDQGLLKADNINLPSIVEWLKTHPARASHLMHDNPSYVFFTQKNTGPTGSGGYLLTPGRSLAVDRHYLPLGVPLFLSTTVTADKHAFNHLVVAQDTGGAIKGPVRGDIFFGFGDVAQNRAGFQNAQGRLWLLLPRHVG